MVTNGQVRVIRFFSKSLVGSQLNWSGANNISPPLTLAEQSIVALVPMMVLPDEVSAKLKRVHNSTVGYWGFDICRRRLKRNNQCGITDRMIKNLFVSALHAK